MVGCVTTRDPYCLVSELPSKGDLLTYLHTQRALIVDGHKSVEVNSHMLIHFAEQIAIGMVSIMHLGTSVGLTDMANHFYCITIHIASLF